MNSQPPQDQGRDEDDKSEEKEVRKCRICSRRHRTPTPMCPRGPA